MNSPHKNYKYRSQEAALLDLLDGSIFFAKHSHFHLTNDKLEGEFLMETSGLTFLETVSEALNLINKNKGNANKIIKPSPSPDPSYTQRVDEENRKFINQINQLGIFSASTTFDNQAMWTHYCKNEGICLELEWDQKLIEQFNLIICKVEYSNKKRVVNRDQIFKNMLIELSNEHPDWSTEKISNFSLSQEFREKWIKEFIIKCSCVKKTCWEYEDEIRLLSPKSQSFNILKKTLKSVYMFLPRYNTPDFRSEIIKSRMLCIIWVLLVDKYPEVKLFGLSYDKSGTLSKEEIRLSKNDIQL